MAKPACPNCGGLDWTNDGLCKECRGFPTLGYEIADWIEDRCAIPDRESIGQPYLLVDEQLNFLLHFYRLTPEGKLFYWRGGQLVRPQKWGKGPFSSAIICAEAQGPVLFDGWDANGQPVGRPWATPLIQVTAVSQDQTDNVYSALLPMIELGALHGEIEDTGLGRINLPGGGKIEPVTASARSRLGQRVTFIVQDETHSWNEANGGRRLADNQRRNIGGMGGRWLETTNAWDPSENSVAQTTNESPEEREGVYIDDVSPPDGLSIRNKKDRQQIIRIVYGDAVTGCRNGELGAVRPWVDPDRIDAEIRALLGRDPAQAERFFGNRKEAAEAKAFDLTAWAKSGVDQMEAAEKAFCTIGVDGSLFEDSLAIVGCEIESGFQWVIGLWERPESASEDYEHPLDEVDGTMMDAMERLTVWRVYIDPGSGTGNIAPLVEQWQGRWGEKRVIKWYMHRPRPTSHAVAKYVDAVAAGKVPHSKDKHFERHIKNAMRWHVNVYDDERRQLFVLGKDRPGSPLKMDLAAAGTLAWEARGDAIAENAKPPNKALYIRS